MLRNIDTVGFPWEQWWRGTGERDPGRIGSGRGTGSGGRMGGKRVSQGGEKEKNFAILRKILQ